MKIRLHNNAELVIEASDNLGDYDKCLAVAEMMVDISDVECIIAAVEVGEYVHVTAIWEYFQANELKELYKAAKAALQELS